MYYERVFFDCDGTLVDTEEMTIGLVGELCAGHGCPATRRNLIDMVVGISWATTYHAIGEHLRAGGVEIDDAAVCEVLHGLLAPRHFDPGLVLPSSVALLRALAARLPVDVVSGSTVEQVERHLHNCGVRPLVERIIGEGMAPAGKPDPAPYLLAAELAGVAPGRCLAFEDSVAGVGSARAAGVEVIGLDRHGHADLLAAGADLVVDDLARIDVDRLLADGIEMAS